jgi:hypothetical protein
MAFQWSSESSQPSSPIHHQTRERKGRTPPRTELLPIQGSPDTTCPLTAALETSRPYRHSAQAALRSSGCCTQDKHSRPTLMQPHWHWHAGLTDSDSASPNAMIEGHRAYHRQDPQPPRTWSYLSLSTTSTLKLNCGSMLGTSATGSTILLSTLAQTAGQSPAGSAIITRNSVRSVDSMLLYSPPGVQAAVRLCGTHQETTTPGQTQTT